MDWFLHDSGLRLERVKGNQPWQSRENNLDRRQIQSRPGFLSVSLQIQSPLHTFPENCFEQSKKIGYFRTIPSGFPFNKYSFKVTDSKTQEISGYRCIVLTLNYEQLLTNGKILSTGEICSESMIKAPGQFCLLGLENAHMNVRSSIDNCLL